MKIFSVTVAFSAALVALASTATAQSFNVDVEGGTGVFPTPAASFGAAAGQIGTWNSKTPLNTTATALTDVGGVLTTVMLQKTVGANAAWNGNDPGTSGQDQNLMDDIHDLAGGPTTWVISNLAAGNYDLYTYLWGNQFAGDFTLISVNAGPTSICGGPWVPGYLAGTTHTVHNVTVSAGGSITIDLAPDATTFSIGNFNGFQLRKNAPPTVTSSCFGNGTGTACPCAAGGPAGGCPNSTNPLGASLTASGTPSISNDTMILAGSGMGAIAPVQYFQGATSNPGIVFGDGLRCATGTAVRLDPKTNVGGASTYPEPGDPKISVKGMNVAGNTRHYQGHYRDAAIGFCSVATFNMTSMVSWTWVP